MDESHYELAQELADAERDAGVRRALGRPLEQPLLLNGVRICKGCYDPIPQHRLEASPDAVRCFECQSEKEAFDARG